MLKRSVHLKETLERNGWVFKRKGIYFLDCYNRQIKEDISGTISTRVNAGNDTYIMYVGEKNEHNGTDR